MNNQYDPVCEAPREDRRVTTDLQGFMYALTEIETVTEDILRKIDGGSQEPIQKTCKEPICISETLEQMKIKAERVYNRLMQINSFL